MVESKIELLSAVKSLQELVQKQAEETANMKAEMNKSEVKRTQGARRAAGVFVGQGDGTSVTPLDALQGGFETHDAFALHGTAVHHRGARPRDLRDISRGEQYLSRIAGKSLIRKVP